MKFGFDIDDTLINLREHAFYIYCNKLKKDVPIEEFHELQRVEIHEPFGLSDEEGSEMWNSTLEEIYYTDCPPFPDAVITLKELDKAGHEIYYITSRPKEHGERTKQWMRELGFPIKNDHFYYGMKDEEKIHIIKKLDLDYYFDDKPDVLNTLIETTSTKVFVKDQSYNRNIHLPRIKEWKELAELIKLDI